MHNRIFLLALCAASALVWAEAPVAAPSFTAVHLIGLPGVDRNCKGLLLIKNGQLTFSSASATAQVPVASISGFLVDEGTKALVGGTAGRLLLLAPFGSGRALSMIRTGVETLSAQFQDNQGARHGFIVMLARGDGDTIGDLIRKAGVHRDAVLPDEEPATPASKHARVFEKEKLANSVLQVEPITSTALPQQFRISIYEQLIDALWNSGKFVHVYRAGDRDAANKPDRLRLTIDTETFKKGSERMRTLTTFGGATVIRARVRITDGHQAVLLDQELTGSVRAYGENLNAADSLVKKVGKVLR